MAKELFHWSNDVLSQETLTTLRICLFLRDHAARSPRPAGILLTKGLPLLRGLGPKARAESELTTSKRNWFSQSSLNLKVASALNPRVHMLYGTSLTLDEIIDSTWHARFLYPEGPCHRSHIAQHRQQGKSPVRHLEIHPTQLPSDRLQQRFPHPGRDQASDHRYAPRLASYMCLKPLRQPERFHQYILLALRSCSINHLRPFTTRSCFCYLPVHAIVAEMLHQHDTARLSYDILFTLEHWDTDLRSISLNTSKL
ncbi:Uncharacterized protein Y057_1501 [Fusarium fujikuroi]|nr:Uncharacterized protein Y057_1501 [Fusarium fujikuroi]